MLTWGNIIHSIFIIYFFGTSKRLCIIRSFGVKCNSSLSKSKLSNDASLELKTWNFKSICKVNKLAHG